MKDVLFHPAVRNIVRSFPKEVKQELGKAIYELQVGVKLTYPVSKPISSVGKGVEELRIKDATGAYRVFYLAKFEETILIFHAFQKKTQKTPLKEINVGRKR